MVLVFANQVSYDRFAMMNGLGFKFWKQEPLANIDHTFRYVYRVPRRIDADLLKSVFDLK